MKEHSVDFKDWEVTATLDGRKTQARRVMKQQPPDGWEPEYYGMLQPLRNGEPIEPDPKTDRWGVCGQEGEWGAMSPFGQPGDMLWVRETWQRTYPRAAEIPNPRRPDDGGETIYRERDEDDWTSMSWLPSIHMPRWASRLSLLVKSVRVERVQAISPEDIEAEGVSIPGHHRGELHHPLRWRVDHFKPLWDSINAKRGYDWDTNPWVWVVEFERIGDV